LLPSVPGWLVPLRALLTSRALPELILGAYWFDFRGDRALLLTLFLSRAAGGSCTRLCNSPAVSVGWRVDVSQCWEDLLCKNRRRAARVLDDHSDPAYVLHNTRDPLGLYWACRLVSNGRKAAEIHPVMYVLAIVAVGLLLLEHAKF